MSELPKIKGIALLPPMFDALAVFDKTLLKQSGVIQTVAKGSALLSLGEPTPYAFFIQSGWCALYVDSYVTQLLAPQSAFMVSLTETVPAWGTVVSLSKVTVVCLELKTLRVVLDRNPWLMALFFETALRRLARAHVFYALKGAQPLEHRLADVMWHVSTPDESGSRILPASLTQTVLASLLGAPREEVNRKRQLLVKTGYLYEMDGQWQLDAMTPLLLAHMPATLTGREFLV